jgi:two-component system sensor histidine kinase ChvG
MESAIAIAKSEGARSEGAKSKSAPPTSVRVKRRGARAPRWAAPFLGSRLGRTIIALNVLGLMVLVSGALVLSEVRGGLINAQVTTLATQGRFIANIIDESATLGEPEPVLDAQRARDTLLLLFIPKSQRARIFDAQGRLIADSYVIGDQIETNSLPNLRKAGGVFRLDKADEPSESAHPIAAARARAALEAEARKALNGEAASGVRPTASGDRVVSVSIPIQHVRAVTGVLTLEAGDLDEIVARERIALIPFIVIAGGVTLLSSLLLNLLIARPVRKLARAADKVRLSHARSIAIPEISRRDDELGDLGRALAAMTETQVQRMDAIDRFAADVAHEIRNPLTSMRSAVETLSLVTDQKAKDRLMGILTQDVARLDRLITDISNTSRLDAELSREQPKSVDVGRLLEDIIRVYESAARPGQARVSFAPDGGKLTVAGREGPLGQVFRNLIDNARSFTVLGAGGAGAVRVTAQNVGREVVVRVEDDGPGIPPENLETVFERFYTERPRESRGVGGGGTGGAGNSGLGLSIARQIVDAHGGRIWAENRMDEGGKVMGARFTVALPATNAAPAAS